MPYNPAVVERQSVDISLGGPDESVREELVDWTKKLTTAKNVAYDFKGGLNKRPGVTSLATQDDTAAAFSNVYRLVPTDDGLAFIGKNHVLYHVNEATAAPVAKGRTSEWGVNRITGTVATRNGYAGATTGLTPEASLIGAYYCARYRILLTYGSAGGSYTTLIIAFLDKNSGNVVRRYSVNTATVGSGFAATVVDDRYLHVYYTETGGTKGKFFQVDSQSLAASGALTPTTVTLADPTDGLLVGAVAISGKSVVVQNKSTTTYLETFSTAGASVANATITTWNAYGVATDGTSFYLSGYVTSGPTDSMKVVSSALSVTRTVTDASPTAGRALRIAVDPSGNATLVSYTRQASGLHSGIKFPVATVYSVGSAATTFTTIGTMPAWAEHTQPFYNSVTQRFYVGLLKQMTGNLGTSASRDTLAGSAVLVDITAKLDQPYYSSTVSRFRPTAVLDNYTASIEGNEQEYGTKLLAFNNSSADGMQAPICSVSSDGYNVLICVPEQLSSNSYSMTLVELSNRAPEVVTPAGNVWSGGVTGTYDNLAACELGFVDTPSIIVKEAASGTGLTAGLHTVYAVYIYRSANGVVYSRMSRPSAVTTVVDNLDWELINPSVASHGAVGGAALIDAGIYITTAGGQTLYAARITSPVGATVTTGNITVADSAIQLAAEAYRQPEYDGAAKDRFPPLASSHIQRHKDRLFICNGTNVYYSSFFVDGESPWFNPEFFIAVPGGQGPVTGTASLDGNLVVFKRNAVFLVDGDGPSENGGTGTEFSPPRRLATEFGCIEPRSIVSTPMGVFFRSDRGIELLSRSLSVDWVGEEYQTTINAFQYISGATFDRQSGRVLFTAASALTADNRVSAGTVLVFDTTVNQWAQWPLATAMQDVAYSRLAVSGTEDNRICYASADTVWYEASHSLDGSTYAPYDLETGWIRMESLQDRLFVNSMKALAKKQDNHDLTLSVAYDYSDTYTDTITFKASSMVDMEVEQFEFQLPTEAVQAVRFRLQDAAPSDSGNFPVTTGKGPDLFGMTVKLGKKGGGKKLPDEQRG